MRYLQLKKSRVLEVGAAKLLAFLVAAAFLFLPGFACAESLTLTWTVSKTKVNGSPLKERLAGYKIYRGPSSRHYTKVTKIKKITANHRIRGLNLNKNYCFAITAFDKDGIESGFSNEVCYYGVYSIEGTVAVKKSITKKGGKKNVKFGLKDITVSLSGGKYSTTGIQKTDKKGKYLFNHLSKGKYKIKPTALKYVFTPSKKSVILKGRKIAVKGQDFTAKRKFIKK